jgi:hypothetical protein
MRHQRKEIQMWAFIFQPGPRRSGEMGEGTRVEEPIAAAGAIESGPVEATRPASRAENRSIPISGARLTLRRSRRFHSDGVLGLRWLA